MGLGKHSLSGQGGEHGCFEPFGQANQVPGCPGRSESEIQQRPLGSEQDPGGSLHDFGIRHRECGRCIRNRWGGEVRVYRLHFFSDTGRCRVGKQVQIRRHLDHDRTGRRSQSYLAGAAHRIVQLASVQRPEHSLRHGPRDRQLVHVVQLEGVPGIRPDPATENQHRHTVEVRFGDA